MDDPAVLSDPPVILGISAFYHDSAAALIRDGRIVAAAQEERFTRRKHDSCFPARSVEFCLRQAGVPLSRVDHVVFYDKPLLKFERLLETYLAFAPRGFTSFRKAMPVWIKEKLFLKKTLLDELGELEPSGRFDKRKLLFSEHHLSHAASAFYPSPFDEALVLTLDGVGEWATTTAALGRGKSLEIFREIRFPDSLGMLYSAFTYFCGFKVNSGEYKLMGLAPYGVPRFVNEIREKLIEIRDDGTFRLNQEYFDYCTGLTMTGPRFDALFGGKPRRPESPLTQREMDLAASVQAVTEEVLIKLSSALARETGMRNLCLAGGVALNCVANGKLLRSGTFEKIWIQPAAGDAGGAIGAALCAHHLHLGRERAAPSALPGGDGMSGAYLGPEFADAEIERALGALGARARKLGPGEIVEKTAELLAQGRAVGWFQGRMEFGPRALGARSILADPRSEKTQRLLNLKIKFRESFRPFAPAVLREDVSDWFEADVDSPYMLLVAEVARSRRTPLPESSGLWGIELLNQKRSTIPAVTHVDYSARIQTVHRETHPVFHALLRAFREKTGCPVLVNTSFNVRGEPIVCSPEDAFRCLMGTELDALAIGSFLVLKSEQDAGLARNYQDRFELD